MRYTALLAWAVVLAGCTKKDEAPAVDTTAVAPAPAPAPMSLASFSGKWHVEVKPEGKDTVLTAYTMDATDSTNWHFRFDTGKEDIPQQMTGRMGDTVMLATDWFNSSVRKGMKAKTESKAWMQEGKIMGKVTAHYQNAGADSLRIFDIVGTKQ
jgi:hypothetical protein